ncbi:MAG: hypothetical protein IJU15_03355 [Synergistaceae bacterium]|nr:hypothetical protein [Synergistaceae bacterium]
MNYYFIDYENTGPEGLTGIEKLDGENTLFIFYSTNADKITFDIHIKLNKSEAAIKYYKVKAGQKNALDFQLASYLGFIIKENSESQCKYFIVSKDNGFSSLLSFWKERGVNLELIINTTGQSLQAPASAAKELEQKVSELLNDSVNSAAIANIITSYKTKQGINNALVKLFQSKKGGEIYKAIKTLIADKKGN